VNKYKNKIIVIGNWGNCRCYLNITMEEAYERYKKSHVSFDFKEPTMKYEIEFDDEFGVERVWY